MQLKKGWRSRVFCGAVVIIVLFFTVAPFLFSPKIAKAVPVEETLSIPSTIKTVLEKIWEAIKTAGYVAFRNTLNLVLGQMAQQGAEYIASGGQGQKPMFSSDPNYWIKLADQQAGAFIEQLATSGGKCTTGDPNLIGRSCSKDSDCQGNTETPGHCKDEGLGLKNLNLCDIPDPQLKFQILASMDDQYNQQVWSQASRCSVTGMWKSAKEAWKNKGIKIDFDLKEGPVARYKSDLGLVILQDGTINQTQKTKLTDIIDRLSNLQDTFAAYVKRINSGSYTPDTVKGGLEGFKNILSNIIGVNESPTQSQLSYWLDGGQECLRKNKEDFCNTNDCWKFFGNAPSSSQCLALFDACIVTTRRVTDYSKTIYDWASGLEKMISDIEPEDIETYAQNVGTLEDLSKMFNPEGNDIGVQLGLQSTLLEQQGVEVEKSKFWKSLQGQINDVVSPISTLTKTPAIMVDATARKGIEEGTASLTTVTGVALADALNTFTSTLINKMIKNIVFGRGLNPGLNPDFPGFGPDRKQPFLTGDGNIFSPGKKESQAIYADLATVTLKRGDKLDILSEFSACPDSKYALPNNCTLDPNFVQAVGQKMTIREAVDAGLLHGDWSVGAYGVRDTTSDYSTRYSLTNIKKLRRARIVPLGLEIAAQKIANGDVGDQPVKLNEIIDGFNNNSSTWYHLVDPNWVIKVPELKCESIAYSSIPVAGTNQRQEVCVDMKDCIHENEKGECDTYAYCTREKNIWRLGGDECDGQYASCLTYTRTSDKRQFSYLKDTLNTNGCDQNSAGCRWYCQRYVKGLAANGQDTWACIEPGKSLRKRGTNYETYDDSTNIIFFNNKIEKCSSGALGCSEFINISLMGQTNLLPNGSFERYAPTSQPPKILATGWIIKSNSGTPNSKFINDQEQAKTGEAAALIDPNDDRAGVKLNVFNGWSKFLLPNYTYTLSIWVNNKTGRSQNLELYADTATGGFERLFRQRLPKSATWSQWSYSFTAPLVVNNQIIKLETLRWELEQDGTEVSDFVYFDDLKLEPQKASSSYQEYGALNKTYFKKAPEYMNCYNRDSSDHLITYDNDPKCIDFVSACNPEEIGCELYKPLNNDPVLPAVANDLDRCPAECNGYEIFRELGTNFSAGQLAVNLIPSTARTCPAAEVGCEEFTNLDEIAKGGEGREYYNYIRPCRKPDNNCSYYFTWVGSDTNGYQLQKYYLQKAADNSPDQFLTPAQAKALWGECDTDDDILTNPNCKQFYDANGQVYLRLYKNTISCSDSCHPLRKTTPVDAAFCRTQSQSGISFPGMSYINGICTYMAIPGEGTSCNKVNAGCREYKGNAAYNVRQVFLDDMEGSSVAWSVNPPVTMDPFSPESIYLGGHSLRITNDRRSAVPVYRDVKDLVAAGKVYQFSFWVKGITGNITFGITGNPASVVNLGTIDNWRLVTIGPYYVNTLPLGLTQLLLSMTPNIPSETAPVVYSLFLDNLSLKEVKNNIYLINNSWVTPRTCDYNAQGQPDSMIGCQAYRDRQNKTNYFRSFSSLCEERAIGCQAMIDTKNSTNPFEEIFVPNQTIAPADSIEYLINDSRMYCSAADKGCERFGLPTLVSNDVCVGGPHEGEPCFNDIECLRGGGNGYCSHGNKVKSWSDQYFKNNPDLYKIKPILCDSNGLACDEYLAPGSTTPVYFKDPGDRLCEYKENVFVSSLGERKTGWFKRGTDEACYANYVIYKSTDKNYHGMVGVCPTGQSTCTDFKDALDNKSYYFLNNSKIDTSSCRGVSQKEGCVLLNNTTQKSILYNSAATYKKSEANNYNLVSPISCLLNIGGDTQIQPKDYCQGNNLETDFCKYCHVNGWYTNDSNIIVKVERDRTCGEWLTCGGGQNIWDKSSNAYKEQCDSWIRCDKLVGSGDAQQCGHFIDPNPPQKLTEDLYKNRDISWSGLDYSGYSLYNFYPIEKLTPKNYNPLNQEPEYHLTYLDGSSDEGVQGKSCPNGSRDCPLGQTCSAGFCVVSKTCQAYPEENSPYLYKSNIEEYYPKVNFCSNSDGEQCQCFYQKVEYGQNGAYVSYWNRKPTDSSDPPIGVCVSAKGVGHNIGDECDPGTVSTPPSIDQCGLGKNGMPETYANGCESISKKTVYYGKRNYCLEPDPTKLDLINACITWWPGSASIGDPDLNNLYTSAGYLVPNNRQMYCVGAGVPNSMSTVAHFPDINDANFWAQQCTANCTQRPTDWYTKNSVPGSTDVKICKCAAGAGDCSRLGSPHSNTDRWYSYFVDEGITSASITKNIQVFGDSGCVGLQEDHHKLFGLGPSKRITLGMIDNIQVSACWDWGGADTDCGECNDVWGDYYADRILPAPSDNCHFALVKTAGGTNPETISMKFCFNGSDVDSTLETIRYDFSNAGNANSDGIWALTRNIKINFKWGCTAFVDVSDDSAIIDNRAYTNRVSGNESNPVNYYGNTEIVDNKTINNVCKLWGAANYDYGSNKFAILADTGTQCLPQKVWWQASDRHSIYNLDSFKNNIFASTLRTVNWDNATWSYSNITGGFNVTDSAPSSNAPKIYAVCPSSQSGVPSICRLSDGTPIQGMTIGTAYNQNIVREQAFVAVLKFYSYADKNHMPIREVFIDWDDGPKTSGSINMLAKNHQENCPKKCVLDGLPGGPCMKSDGTAVPCENLLAATCNIVSDCPESTCGSGGGPTLCSCKTAIFTDSSDACTAQPWQYTHVYTCEGSGSEGWEEYGCQGACCFRPIVYLRDNWDWCANGSFCNGPSCKDTNRGVIFNGTIIVKPPPQP